MCGIPMLYQNIRVFEDSENVYIPRLSTIWMICPVKSANQVDVQEMSYPMTALDTVQ